MVLSSTSIFEKSLIITIAEIYEQNGGSFITKRCTIRIRITTEMTSRYKDRKGINDRCNVNCQTAKILTIQEHAVLSIRLSVHSTPAFSWRSGTI
jgi:hypothetical protein